MRRLSLLLGLLTLVASARVVAGTAYTQSGQKSLQPQMAAAEHQAREAQRAQRLARMRWEAERRRSAAHARMADTMYASTPSTPVVELSCPVVTSDDVRRAVLGWGDEVSSSPFSSADLLAARDGGVRAPPLQGVLGRIGSSGDDASAAGHDARSGALATASNADTTSHLVPLFPAASDAALQGFVRVINHSGDAGEVQIEAIDDMGRSYGPLTLLIDATETVHFNSDDLEGGNAGKGLTGSTGAGEGDWRLVLTSDLDVEVLSYIRTTDGFLTAMHDLAPEAEGVHRIAIFNPGSNTAQVSRLRLINPGEEQAQVTIEGVDDRGMSPGSALEVTVAAGATQTLTAAELESGGTGMTGALGDGAGKWQLTVKSESSIHALSLLSSPTGHLTNLSTAPSNLVDGVHEVSLFPSASDISGRQGFVRVINRSESTAEITIRAHDETDWEYDPLTLSLQGGQVAHFNSDDLEQGNAGKGLTGSTGAGEGDWRLALSSDADIEVLSYIRTTDGFLTAMHDVAPVSGTRHRVAIFNPGSNTAQVSRLRLLNAGEEAAAVTIASTDDQGLSPGGEVLVTVPAGGTRTYTAQELEEGAEGLEGALGDGAGKWRLTVTSDEPIRVLSLLSSPTGHLTNLSTATVRDASGVEERAEEVFRTLISPIVQSKCVNCHVEEGVSGNTRLVFATDADPDHLTKNFSVFEDFLAEVEDGASYILNKIQGALGHGGGIQVAAGTEEFSNMERFLGLVEGEEVVPVTITPATLFEGVKLESWRSTLGRAAIIFAGRIPTDEEYESIRGATVADFRAAIRDLMQGPEFHEFLIRASNDRLLTDRALKSAAADVIDVDRGYFVDFANFGYEQQVNDPEGFWTWYQQAQYSFARAPLELIAHVTENDLPYTEILTADYIMANPLAARAYGASTEFDDPKDLLQFKPSEIVSYYREDDSKVTEVVEGRTRVLDPGDLSTDYPHAGVLNTNSFLVRYPSTATNRNRARSRWTYYHFVGLDVEKSASRTTDPAALADTDNPTMHNPACTVCHTVLDPVAGAFQNYGDDGIYRDKWGGMDSLDSFYKRRWSSARETFEVTAKSLLTAQTISVSGRLKAGRQLITLEPSFDSRTEEGSDIWWNMGIDRIRLSSDDGVTVFSVDAESLGLECGRQDRDEESGDRYWHAHFCPQEIPIEVSSEGRHELSMTVWERARHEDVAHQRRLVTVTAGAYQPGDTWYRDMRTPGFNGELAPGPDNSLQWLTKRIVADERFAEATVKFWWPAIMGGELSEPPEIQTDADFEGRLVGSNAQAEQVARLARGFRRGFGEGLPYRLKDLLIEIVMSRWFRADSLGESDAVRAVALADAGARRLLTPEELARKMSAVTGFEWERQHSGEPGFDLGEARNWTNIDDEFGLLYGGIDSDGVTERARDLSSVMASVAQSHAVQASCPVVMKDFYLLPKERRRLLGGVDRTVTPTFEFGSVFEIEAGSWAEREVVSVVGDLPRGDATVTLSFLNNEPGPDPIDRNIRVDRLDVIASDGRLVDSQELEGVRGTNCGDWGVNGADENRETGAKDHFAFYCNGSVEVPVNIPVEGRYEIAMIVWADQNPSELARLEVVAGSDTERSVGSREIRNKMVDLFEVLHGVEVTVDSAKVASAYELFVDVWNHKRASEYSDFNDREEGIDCDWLSDQYYLDGIVEDAFVYREDWDDEWGARYDWDWDRINAHFETIDWSDTHGVARTWTVVLAYLLMDYRYLYL